MASEIRVDKINSLSGVGTVTLSPTGVDIAGITTAATLRATTGIVTSLTAGSLTSLGAVSGTTGTFSGAVSGTTGTFSGDISVNGGDVTVTGGEGVSASLQLIADQGDDNGDGWEIRSNQDDNDLTIKNNTSGSYVDKFTLLKTGELTLTSDLTIPDKIIHTGDTDTAIRFSAADTVSVETGGTNRITVNNTTGVNTLDVAGGTRSDFFVGRSNQSVPTADVSMYRAADNTLALATASTARLRINSGGRVVIGSTTPHNGANLTVAGNGLCITGQNVAHLANSLCIGEEGSGVAQLRAYGSDTSTYGQLNFVVSASDGTQSNSTVSIKRQGLGGASIVLPTGSSGICFEGSTNAANALDDYEEGTFTPRLGGTSNSSTYYVTGNGWYRKIGSMVYTCVRFNGVDLNDTASGEVKIHNLPFTANSPVSSTDSMTSDFSTFNVVFNTSYQYAWYASNGGTSWVGLVSRNNTSWASWNVSDFHAGNLYINFSGWYQTNS